MSGITTHHILFAIAVIIGLLYAMKYADKAKSEIAEYKNKESKVEQNPYDGNGL